MTRFVYLWISPIFPSRASMIASGCSAMRLLCASLLLFAIHPAGAQQRRSPGTSGGLKPGALQSMTRQPLHQVIAGRPMAALPAAAGQSTVITCEYTPARPGDRELRNFWYEEAPRWLSAVPASHPIHTLVRGPVAQCPATLAAADQSASGPLAANDRNPNRTNVRAARPQTAAELVPTSFSAKGLNYEKELTGLYLGDFAHAKLERDSLEFDTLFGSYLSAFARRCSEYLPANKVEMTRSECAREQYSVDRYGNRVGSSSCVEYRQVGTGLYADPDLYAAQRQVDADAGRNMVRDTFKSLAGKDPMGAALHTLDAAGSVGSDMDSLLGMNACASPGLKRFQDNMMRFALGQPPLRLAGGETLASIAPPKPSPGAPFKDSNYTKLLEDLVSEHSQVWMVNRYVRGSASGVTVSSRDGLGRPSKIVGQYLFDSISGRSKGSVTVQFADGLPQCMYFFDFPTTCRSPSRRIITAYENGRYQE